MTQLNYRANGRLHLAFTKTHPQAPTTLRIHAQQPPLRVVRAFHNDDGNGATLAHVHNISGGVLGGDRLELMADVGCDAQAQITSTGATRVYRHRAGMPTATQCSRFRVGRNGLLEYLPDPLIPFAQSRYHQETHIELADNAGLFCWELLAPGREAHDEVFAYEALNLSLRIVAAERPIARERFTLEPAQRPLSSAARMGDFRYLATLYICRVGVKMDTWLALEDELNEWGRCPAQANAAVWGVSTLPAHGLVVRGLGHTGRTLSAGLVEMWQAAKQRLYGQKAVLPRKIY